MKRAGNFLLRQSALVLENKQQAVLYAALLSVIPFGTWLSVVLVALVTLRKGAVSGFELLLPALVIHSVPLLMMVPVHVAIINTLLAYLPCFLAALTLRKHASWQIAAGVFFAQACAVVFLIQVLAPDFVINQFKQFKSIIAEFQEYQSLLAIAEDQLRLNVMAQLFFSIQIISITLTATASLLVARSLQSRLFMPDGFANEMKAFRSGKVALLLLLVFGFAAYCEVSLAMNVLPLLLGYFLLSGVNLLSYAVARKNQLRAIVLLVLPVLMQPVFVLLTYVVIGSLDSIFNFRLYLPVRVREST